MRQIIVVLATLAIASLPVFGQPRQALYKLLQEGRPERRAAVVDGRQVARVTVRFTVVPLNDGAGDVDSTYRVKILENKQEMKTVDLPKPQVSGDVSVIMALDCSGGMREKNKMVQAQKASGVFFQNLPSRAEAGALLFDHRIIESARLGTPRNQLEALINGAVPKGGTAYYDAAVKAIHMLDGVNRGDKYIVLVTDGVDTNSDSTQQQVIELARQKRVRIHTVGIGEAGKRELVTTVLALDRSGSMLAPADTSDKILKIEALKDAAERFVRSIREDGVARSAVLEFSSDIKSPVEFTNSPVDLKRQIKNLLARGETSVFDATYAAVAMLAAEKVPPKRTMKKAVIALTDGVDNTSRRRPEEVIERAKEAGIPLYMLGFGRAGELDEAAMKDMAAKTGGRYYHATNKDALIEIFEDLAGQLNDDGIDEDALRTLSTETGGRYFAARDVNKLQLILEQVTKNLERKEYTIEFDSKVDDIGLQVPVELVLIREGVELGSSDAKSKVEVVGPTITSHYQTRGNVVAEMDHLVFVGFLGLLGLLLAVPASFKRLGAGKK